MLKLYVLLVIVPDKIGGYDEKNITAFCIKRELTHQIMLAMDDGYTRFIVGGALGIDTWAGETVAQLREQLYDNIILELYSPFEGQEGNWNLESQLRYFNLMARCDNIVYVSEAGYAAWKMQVRNKAMVDNSDLVIAVYDGSGGGTGNCVAYAQKQGKPIIIIDPREAVK